MAKNSIFIDLDDPRSSKIGDVISNKTCKKILEALLDKEMSEGDLAKKLKVPLNTVEYNIKKLIGAGLIEKSKKFFWSAKGKRIVMYKVSNKRIVISPKTMFRGIIPAVVVSGLAAIGLGFIGNSLERKSPGEIIETGGDLIDESGSSGGAESVGSGGAGTDDIGIIPDGTEEVMQEGILYLLFDASYIWLWFLEGALLAIVVILLWNGIRRNK